jgi:hypothetical protein
MDIRLKAGNATETRVLEYLTGNASEVLAEKINAGTKTLAGALDYANGEAKKIANGEGCVCVDDATVWGWIVHYFEEESITEKAKAGPKLPGAVAAKAAKPAPAPKAAKPAKQVAKPEPKPAKVEEPVQLTLFEALLGGPK